MTTTLTILGHMSVIERGLREHVDVRSKCVATPVDLHITWQHPEPKRCHICAIALKSSDVSAVVEIAD